MASHFEICKLMAERGLDIRLSTVDNITEMRLHRNKKDTMVTIGIQGNIIGEIFHGKLVGGLLLCNAEQYQQIKKELENK